MKFQIVSDLHLDNHREVKYDPDLHKYDPLLACIDPKNVDALIVAGDVVNGVNEPLLRRFLTGCSKMFPRTYYVLGNHEYFGEDVQEANGRLMRLCGEVPRVHLLNNAIMLLAPRLAIHGTTLWSPARGASKGDFSTIRCDGRAMISADSGIFHRRNVEWLDSALTLTDQHGYLSLVVTHHAPLGYNTYAKKYANAPELDTYVSDLSPLIRKHRDSLKTWVFGHTHWFTDFIHDTTHIVSNPLGYRHERTGYQKDCVIEIPGV